MLGLAVGVVSLPNVATGLFLRDLEAELGWSRTAISSASVFFYGGLIVTAPFVGWLADRVAAIWIVGLSLVAVAVGFVLFSQMGSDVRMYYVLVTLVGMLGAGTSSLVFSRIVNANFDQARGTALGLAMIGNGVAQAVAPLFLAPYATQHGWRQGYFALAVTGAIALPIVLVLLSRASDSDGRRDLPRAVGEGGSRFTDALKDRAFWTMAIAFMLIIVPTAGLITHFVSLLRDQGMTPGQVGLYASLQGLFLIAGRILTGWLVDRIFAPFVAATVMVLSALGFLALAMFGAAAAPIGALAIGIAYGAEIDLVGYLTARYFGMRAFGRCYGTLYGCLLFGAVLGPIVFGVIFDRTKSYDGGLLGGAALLVLAALLLLSLRRFTDTLVPGHPRANVTSRPDR